MAESAQKKKASQDELDRFAEYVRELEGRGIRTTSTCIMSDGLFVNLLQRTYRGRLNELKRDADVEKYCHSNKETGRKYHARTTD